MMGRSAAAHHTSLSIPFGKAPCRGFRDAGPVNFLKLPHVLHDPLTVLGQLASSREFLARTSGQEKKISRFEESGDSRRERVPFSPPHLFEPDADDYRCQLAG